MSFGEGFSRREFLKVAGATSAAVLIPDISVPHVEATEKKKPLKPSLRGSPEALKKQNEEADKVDLTRIEDDAQLAQFVKSGFLTPIPQDKTIRIDSRLEKRFRYIRPWTARFLKDIGRDYHMLFKAPIQVNSGIRTMKHQHDLREKNPNAAPTHGPKRSSHLTGATVDIAKLPMSKEQLEWMRKRLLALEKQKFIEATEEHRQKVFHIMVFKEYRR